MCIYINLYIVPTIYTTKTHKHSKKKKKNFHMFLTDFTLFQYTTMFNGRTVNEYFQCKGSTANCRTDVSIKN